MRYYLLLSVLLLINLIVFGQQLGSKHLLDTSDISKWTSVSGGILSLDGRYAMFTINNEPFGNTTLVVRQTSGKKNISLIGSNSEEANFSSDNKTVVFKKEGQLGILSLQDMKISYLEGAGSYSLFKCEDVEQLIYEVSNESDLHIRPLKGGKEHVFNGINQWWLNKKGNSIIVLRDALNDSTSSSEQLLEEISLINWQSSIVWKGPKTLNVIRDLLVGDDGNEFAFISSNGVNNIIYYYHLGFSKAVVILNDREDKYISESLYIKNLVKIGSDGNHLFYTVERIDDERPSPSRTGVMVDVWSYLDKRLQTQQQQDLEHQPNLTFGEVVNVSNHSVMRLQGELETMTISRDGRYVFITRQEGADYESGWNLASLRYCHIIDVESGQKHLIGNIGIDYSFSVGSRYFIYQDSCNQKWFSYNLQTGILTDLLSQGMATEKDLVDLDPFKKSKRRTMVAAWLPNDKKVLLYDDYDIWMLDPSKDTTGVCLTEGYGRSHRMKFWISGISTGIESQTLEGLPQLMLCSFNDITKVNGFYRVDLNHPGHLDSISVCNCVNELPIAFESRPVQKAQNGKGYLLLHMNENEAPNYYYSNDLKYLKPLSHIDPKANIIWNTRRLLTWRTKSGDTLQGILYLPEDFDSSKKYPVIFHYYREKSDEYHQPQRLRFHGSGVEELMPLFTGKGYVVFMLDIHYEPDRLGDGIMEAINSGADEVIKNSFIDSSRMGLQGHSFGGFETNYIVAHSNRFAAAISVAGPSEVLSRYNTLRASGESMQQFIERTLGTKKTLWERPDIYIGNSPILNADKVNTPLLLVNNKQDGAVPYEQGLSFFLSLRRLGKPVWMLQYDNEGHVIRNKQNVIDFLTRVDQFFGHYLKDSPSPKWMSEGIKAQDKGIITGLDY